MELLKTIFDGVYLIRLEKKIDERGFFERLWDIKELKSKNLEHKFIQISMSNSTKKGTLRGIHYQKEPFEEIRLVTCMRGRFFDAVVDLRKDSKTYGKWQGFEFSEDGIQALYLPKGVAHGYQTLEDNTMVLYAISEEYHPECSTGIIWNDKTLGIKWPISNPIISKKDSLLPEFKK